jgi:hypothetical protein
VTQSFARFYLQPLLWEDNTKKLLIPYLNLIAQKRLSEEEDVHGYIYIGGDGETWFKNFDILHEIKSIILKKT